MGATVISSLGASGILNLSGFSRVECIRPNTNTNVLHPRTVIPTLRTSITAGTHWLISAVYGDPGGITGTSDPAELLNVKISYHEITIITTSGKRMVISL